MIVGLIGSLSFRACLRVQELIVEVFEARRRETPFILSLNSSTVAKTCDGIQIAQIDEYVKTTEEVFARMGVNICALTCNTYSDTTKRCLNPIATTVDALDNASGVVVLMATPRGAGLYKKLLDKRAIAFRVVEYARIRPFIVAAELGEIPDGMRREFVLLVRRESEYGLPVLGCTELSMYDIPDDIVHVDSARTLAERIATIVTMGLE